MIAFKRRHPSLHKYTTYLLYAAGFLFVIAISSSTSTLAMQVSVAIMIVLMVPVVFIILLQGSYYMYGWFKYGNMFHDETRPYVYETIVKKEVKARAWCHICKENTGCRIARNPVTGIGIHVINGGGRPRKM